MYMIIMAYVLSLQVPRSSIYTPAHLVHLPILLWSLSSHSSQFGKTQSEFREHKQVNK